MADHTKAAAQETPTADDVREYLGGQPGGLINSNELDKALAAARERVLERCMPLKDPRPEVVDRAIVMQAARLYRRRNSVGGFEGFGELGLVRVPSLDSDVEDLLIRYLSYDFA
jgi:hypothetical protein